MTGPQSRAPRSLVGQSLARREDQPLVRGAGRYLDDIAVPGCLHAAFLRSPVAHARLGRPDLAPARAMPGVVAVLDAAALAPLLPGGDRLEVGLPSSAIAFPLDRPILAQGETVHVGEPIALIVAESRALAEDAAEAIGLEFTALPAVADPVAALADTAPPAHAALPHNCLARFGFSYGDCTAAFAGAAHVVGATFEIERGGAHSLEGRGVLARPDPLSGRLDVLSSTQTPHALLKVLCTLLGREEETISVRVPELGGGFGPKLVTYPEEIAVAAAALHLGRPVKWVEDRQEHFVSATMERAQHWQMEMAVDAGGRILGVRGALIHDHGAWTARGLNVPYASGMMLPLIYHVPAYDLAISVAVTNKTPVTPVRGAGQPQATFVMERLMDKAAAATGLDRAEIRQRNLVQPYEMPCAKPLKLRSGRPVRLDSGDYPATQRAALEAAGWEGFAARQSAARAKGRRLGIGLANYVEGTGRGPYESVSVRITRTGRIHVSTGATAMGQGLATVLVQIVADHLGQDPALVDLALGNSAEPFGFGGFNSRQTVVAGASADAAARAVRGRVLRVAAHLLELPEETLEIEGGLVRQRNGNASIDLASLARAAEGLPGYDLPGIDTPGLMCTERVVIDEMAYANGCCVAEVEVDPETGAVAVQNLMLAHDCGRMVNPVMVDGQIMGGLAHGLGNALYEKMLYDGEAQPLSVTLADYLLVSSAEMPPVQIVHSETPTPLNALGLKGVGESGVIPVAAAVASAVEDALRDTGVAVDFAPISPQALRACLRRAEEGAGAASGTAAGMASGTAAGPSSAQQKEARP